jgi:dTDP-4-amino-4,6-dideoxygalactose transaminase
MNDRLSELEAALALSQLARLPDSIAARQRLAERYHRLLADQTALRLPELSDRIWYRFVVSTKHEAGTLVERMRAGGVDADQPWPEWRTESNRTLPTRRANEAYQHLVSLPLYPTLTEIEQDRVIEEMLDAIASAEEH